MTKQEKRIRERLREEQRQVRKRFRNRIYQIRDGAWSIRISDEMGGALYNKIKDGIILQPPMDDEHQRIYEQSTVISFTAHGRYFTSERPCPDSLLPYVVMDMRGVTPDTEAGLRLVKRYGELMETDQEFRRCDQTLASFRNASDKELFENANSALSYVQEKLFERQSVRATTTNQPHATSIANPQAVLGTQTAQKPILDSGSYTGTPAFAPAKSQYREGALRQVLRNEFERDPDARRRCIEYHGCRCSVCGFDFEEVYGEMGKGYIHVHHLKPLSEIREEYRVDPISDLRPVCPNCHFMLHGDSEVLTIENLRARIRPGGFSLIAARLKVSGSTMEPP